MSVTNNESYGKRHRCTVTAPPFAAMDQQRLQRARARPRAQSLWRNIGGRRSTFARMTRKRSDGSTSVSIAIDVPPSRGRPNDRIGPSTMAPNAQGGDKPQCGRQHDRHDMALETETDNVGGGIARKECEQANAGHP